MPYVYKDRLPLCSKPGIYGIINKVNGKVYVGSALVIRARMLGHRSELRRNIHENEYLRRAWNKYGEDAFRFSVLERCEPDQLFIREQHWIDVTERKLLYNINLIAGGGGMEGRNHSEKSRKQMSEKRKGTDTSKATQAAAEINRGTPRSEEVKAKISKGHKGKKHSEEQKARMKANHWRNRPDATEIIERSAAKHRGKKHSEEHKAKIGSSHWKNRPDADLIAQKVSESLIAANKLRFLEN